MMKMTFVFDDNYLRQTGRTAADSCIIWQDEGGGQNERSC